MRKATKVATVVAVFVAGILLSPMSRETEAQAAFAPVVVGITSHTTPLGSGDSVIYRIWNDGVVERNIETTISCGIETWCGWTIVPE